MTRLLILMSNTGDGHRASAEALQAGFDCYLPGQFQTDIIDIANHLPWPLSQLPKSYAPLINRSPTLWYWLWQATASPTAVDLLARPSRWYVREALCQMVERYTPDLIISVHPMLQHVTLDALNHMDRSLPFVTVVTDLVSAHPAWFHPAVDLCFVASGAAAARAYRAGIGRQRVYAYGLPIRPVFVARRDERATLRRRLSMAPTVPAALIAGGGEGFGPIHDVAVAVADALAAATTVGADPGGQLAIVCGRNRRLERSLRNHSWPVPVTIGGYVENMPDWMFASDCMITKAGPGAIAEALACGLPLILTAYIPGQESGNVDHVVANGAGRFENDPGRIAALAQRWLKPGSVEKDQIVANARRVARPNATRQIVEEIAAYLANGSR